MKFSFADLNLRYKILIPFLTAVLILAGVSVFFSTRSAKKIIYRAGKEQVQDSLFTLNRALSEAQEAEINLVETLSEIHRLQRALATGDRNLALKVITPILKKAQAHSDLQIKVHVHTAEGRSFLRSWAPNQYGDDLTQSRPMIARIIREHRPLYGIEAGRAGLFIRALAPVFYQGQYVGSIETGIPLKEIFALSSGEENAMQALLKPEVAAVMETQKNIGNLILATQYKEIPQKVLKSDLLRQGLEGEKIFLFPDYGLGLEPIKDFQGATIGTFVVGRDLSDLAALLHRNVVHTSLAIFLTLALAIVGIFAITQVLRRQLNLAVSRMEDIAQGEGDLTKELPVTGKDEIGKLSRAFNSFLAKLKHMVQRLKGQVTDITETSEKLEEAAHSLENGVVLVEDQTQNIAHTSEALVLRTEEVHKMISEMEQAVSEISQQTTNAANVAGEAQEQVQAVVNIIDKLGKGSKEIGEVVNFINSIADQTNLLALNATIEAARAGEAGKGFAVVANEIKELARQTGEATEDISQKVHGIQASSEQVVEAVERISQVIARISEVSNTIAAAVEEQTATVSGISENMTDVASQAEGLSKLVPEMQRAAELVRESMDQVKTQRERLTALSQNMRKLVDQFKT